MGDFTFLFIRHNCQDGSDENDCPHGQHAIPRDFWCFESNDHIPIKPIDCIAAMRYEKW